MCRRVCVVSIGVEKMAKFETRLVKGVSYLRIYAWNEGGARFGQCFPPL